MFIALENKNLWETLGIFVIILLVRKPLLPTLATLLKSSSWVTSCFRWLLFFSPYLYSGSIFIALSVSCKNGLVIKGVPILLELYKLIFVLNA